MARAPRKSRVAALTPYERETVIILNDEDDTALVSTHQRSVLSKLERNPAATKVEDLTIGKNPGAKFVMPKKLISFRRTRAARKPKA